MTEREIQLLGFEKQTELDPRGNEWWYYTYDVAKGLSFITNANNECVNGEWFVEFFDTEPNIRFNSFEQFQKLLNIFDKCKVIEEKVKALEK